MNVHAQTFPEAHRPSNRQRRQDRAAVKLAARGLVEEETSRGVLEACTSRVGECRRLDLSLTFHGARAARRKGKGGVRAGASDVVEAQVVAFRVKKN